MLEKAFVLVPSYNHAPFIERCLKSIIKQRLQPKKLLVIDDGSKDESPKIIEKILKKADFDAEFIARKNRGLCATLNEGLEKSSGEFFAYLGSDDLWLDKFLESRARLLTARPHAVLGYGNAFVINGTDEIIDCTENWRPYPDGNPQEMLVRGIAPISSTVFYRRDFLERVGGWNPDSKLEDYELYLKISEYGEFAFDPQILSAWRQHEKNTSRDTEFMLDEVLSAQVRSSQHFNLDEAETRKMKAETELLHSEIFARVGARKRAFSLLMKNFRSIESPAFFVKNILRLAIPKVLLKNLQRKNQRMSAAKYGKIEV